MENFLLIMEEAGENRSPLDESRDETHLVKTPACFFPRLGFVGAKNGLRFLNRFRIPNRNPSGAKAKNPKV
jgi:hypothetical protein